MNDCVTPLGRQTANIRLRPLTESVYALTHRTVSTINSRPTIATADISCDDVTSTGRYLGSMRNFCELVLHMHFVL